MDKSNVKQTELKPGDEILINGDEYEVASVKMEDGGGKTIEPKPVKQTNDQKPEP